MSGANGPEIITESPSETDRVAWNCPAEMAVPVSAIAPGFDTPKEVALTLSIKKVPLLTAFAAPATVIRSPIERAEKLVVPDATVYTPELLMFTVQPPVSFRFAEVVNTGVVPAPVQLKQVRRPCFSTRKVDPAS